MMQQRVKELERGLASERDKGFIAVSKHNSLERDTESLRQQLVELNTSLEDSLKREKDTLALLRTEKEKYFVLNARYNSLVGRMDKEKAILEERLRMAEEVVARQSSSSLAESPSALRTM